MPKGQFFAPTVCGFNVSSQYVHGEGWHVRISTRREGELVFESRDYTHLSTTEYLDVVIEEIYSTWEL